MIPINNYEDKNMSKFVSKNANYMIVLRPGVPGSTVTGSQAQPGIYARFRDGQLITNDDNIIGMLKKHQGFGTDFIEVFPNEIDPYADSREDIEPAHVIQEIKYGQVERVMGSKKKVKVSAAAKKAMDDEVMRMAIKMLPVLLKSNPEILKAAVKSISEAEAKEKSVDKSEGIKDSPKE